MMRLFYIFCFIGVWSTHAFAQQVSSLPIDELRIKSLIAATKHWTEIPPDVFLSEVRDLAPQEFVQFQQGIQDALKAGIEPSLYAPVLIAHHKMASKWQLNAHRRILDQ